MTEQSDLTESGAHLQSAISNQAQPTVGAAFTAPSTPTLALFSEEIGKWVFCIQCTLVFQCSHSSFHEYSKIFKQTFSPSVSVKEAAKTLWALKPTGWKGED
ncbi:hypothetical protein XENORESO_008613 [Xenotaenia resolanae]|uniref:Uncharacterized protein n=1 Tax=Xenotaenia resolanae TaxID=208358 RepID=A0ABV0VPW8_9TELE